MKEESIKLNFPTEKELLFIEDLSEYDVLMNSKEHIVFEERYEDNFLKECDEEDNYISSVLSTSSFSPNIPNNATEGEYIVIPDKENLCKKFLDSAILIAKAEPLNIKITEDYRYVYVEYTLKVPFDLNNNLLKSLIYVADNVSLLTVNNDISKHSTIKLRLSLCRVAWVRGDYVVDPISLRNDEAFLKYLKERNLNSDIKA